MQKRLIYQSNFFVHKNVDNFGILFSLLTTFNQRQLLMIFCNKISGIMGKFRDTLCVAEEAREEDAE